MAPSQVGQVIDHRVFVAVDQHVHDGVVLDVADDASRPYQVNFVNTHPLRCFKPELSLKLIHMVTEDVADGFFIQTRVFCNAGEGTTKTLMANPRHQSLSHLAFSVDQRQ